MGRLRSDYESPLIRGMAEEIVDLFGIDDAYLYRYSSADNITNKDPLWSEPFMGTPEYKKYRIKCAKVDPDQEEAGDPEGRDITQTVTVFVSINHLTQAQIPPDDFGDYVTEGDVISIPKLSGVLYFDITKATKTGWINDAASYSGYNLTCIRREHFSPERKI